MSGGFERLIREAAALRDVDIWEVVQLLSRAAKLKEAERGLAVLAVARALVRLRRLLDVAAELLDGAATSGPSHLVLDGQAQLAELRGDQAKASALRALAASAPDAPTAAEELRSEWASKEIKWREKDSSPEAKRQRLDAYFKARKGLT